MQSPLYKSSATTIQKEFLFALVKQIHAAAQASGNQDINAELNNFIVITRSRHIKEQRKSFKSYEIFSYKSLRFLENKVNNCLNEVDD